MLEIATYVFQLIALILPFTGDVINDSKVTKLGVAVIVFALISFGLNTYQTISNDENEAQYKATIRIQDSSYNARVLDSVQKFSMRQKQENLNVVKLLLDYGYTIDTVKNSLKKIDTLSIDNTEANIEITENDQVFQYDSTNLIVPLGLSNNGNKVANNVYLKYFVIVKARRTGYFLLDSSENNLFLENESLGINRSSIRYIFLPKIFANDTLFIVMKCGYYKKGQKIEHFSVGYYHKANIQLIRYYYTINPPLMELINRKKLK